MGAGGEDDEGRVRGKAADRASVGAQKAAADPGGSAAVEQHAVDPRVGDEPSAGAERIA